MQKVFKGRMFTMIKVATGERHLLAVKLFPCPKGVTVFGEDCIKMSLSYLN